MKSIIASGLLLGMAHGAAIAGPYVNVETNSGFVGNDYTGSATDVHVGVEGDNLEYIDVPINQKELDNFTL